MAVCAAIIGKENSPKYIQCNEAEKELMFHYKVHTSLDVIEEKLASMGKTTDLRELYLGLLYATEDHKVYGFVTNTKVKLVIVIDTSLSTLRDNEIKTMFKRLHQAYTDVICNPFYIPGDVITSKKFDSVARGILMVKSN